MNTLNTEEKIADASGGPCEIALDIETIPNQNPWVREMLLRDIRPSGAIKDPIKIEADIAKKQAAVLDKAGLNGLTCHIMCLGIKVNDIPAVTFATGDWTKERDIIIEFFNYVVGLCGNYAHTVIGHCVIGFDLKILRQRCMVLGIQPPLVFERAFNDRYGEMVYDTALKWNGGDKHDYVKLDNLCLAFGVESPKQGMKGSDVYRYWQAGRIEEIAEYCRGDVEATHAVYKKMTMKF